MIPSSLEWSFITSFPSSEHDIEEWYHRKAGRNFAREIYTHTRCGRTVQSTAVIIQTHALLLAPVTGMIRCCVGGSFRLVSLLPSLLSILWATLLPVYDNVCYCTLWRPLGLSPPSILTKVYPSLPLSLHKTTGRLDEIYDKPEVLRYQIGVINTVHKQQASGIRIQGSEKYMANFFCA